MSDLRRWSYVLEANLVLLALGKMLLTLSYSLAACLVAHTSSSSLPFSMMRPEGCQPTASESTGSALRILCAQQRSAASVLFRKGEFWRDAPQQSLERRKLASVFGAQLRHCVAIGLELELLAALLLGRILLQGRRG